MMLSDDELSAALDAVAARAPAVDWPSAEVVISRTARAPLLQSEPRSRTRGAMAAAAAVVVVLALAAVWRSRSGTDTETMAATAPSVSTSHPHQGSATDTDQPPFEVPEGLDVMGRPLVVHTPDGTAVVYVFSKPSDPRNGVVGSTLSVSIIEPRGVGPADESIAAFARRVVAGDEPIEEVVIGGRRAAAFGTRSLDGAPFGAPERVGRLYVFEVGDLALEVSVDNLDLEAVRSVIESVDDARVASVYAELSAG